ncbi:T9SS type B sorting domain-containing protein [uncultured Kordia sp.]|uniref:T9SS type B sorting domain-containing protein n=1 Tax=uncultured Kordia sp. TaxID=507699 RepID=UPI00260B8F18|nr:T9SS type B sorting domain-containing protein [uncultured Kordia sp.]
MLKCISNLLCKTLLLLFICSYSSVKAQTIEVLNIPTTYGSRYAVYQGFSLEGTQLDYAREKLLEPANFGPGGIIHNSINITSDFGDLNSITSVSQLNSYDIIFIGSVFGNSGSFTESEIDILKAWSAQEKKVMIIAEQPLGNPVSTALGFPLTDDNVDPSTATVDDNARNINIFSGPFGSVSQISQAGTSQGYFLSSCIAPALSRNANGDATILYDTRYNDILIADTGFFQDSRMQSSTSILYNSERAWANLWAWAIREVLLGTTPIALTDGGEAEVVTPSPACEGAEVAIVVSNNVGSVTTWETSTDNGNSWSQITSTSNPLIYDNAVDGQKFRAVTSVGIGCPDYVSSETTVSIVANPLANQPVNMEFCDDAGNNGIGLFDLTTQNATILGSQSDVDFTVRYYTNAIRTDEISATDVTSFNNTSNPQEIFVRVENNTTLCVNDEISFLLLANTLPVANQPEDMIVCVDQSNGYFASFDLTSQNATILGTQSASDFTVHYYRDAARLDEILGSDLITFTNTVNPQEIFVSLYNDDSTCVDDSVSFQLVVNLLPEITLEDEYVLCLDADGNSIDAINAPFLNSPPIETLLNEATYSFEWYYGSTVTNANLIVGETNSSFAPTTAGDYTVVATNILTQCSSQSTTTVIGSYPPESISIGQITESPFSGNDTIEVNVTGNGTYEYSLNNGPWQISNIFPNVSGCDNVVYVRDLINCNEISESISILDYPKFFTPNGDGYNDTWNIQCRSSFPNAKVYIFDRYGKLLKILGPNEIGWDGTYHGNKMPTSDYWFSVEYESSFDNVRKRFASHFTLKR